MRKKIYYRTFKRVTKIVNLLEQPWKSSELVVLSDPTSSKGKLLWLTTVDYLTSYRRLSN